MAHSVSSEGSKADPNLTPLLDMVLQLLMFFMMCVNFVTEQVNEDIKLPRSQAARPMDKSEIEVLFLNLNDKGQLMIVGRDQALDLGSIKSFLRQQYND